MRSIASALIFALALPAPVALAQTTKPDVSGAPSAQNSGAGIAGQPGNKNGPAGKAGRDRGRQLEPAESDRPAAGHFECQGSAGKQERSAGEAARSQVMLKLGG